MNRSRAERHRLACLRYEVKAMRASNGGASLLSGARFMRALWPQGERDMPFNWQPRMPRVR